jgi:CII-binding regulator of phage lambda lysogenization HflD
MNYIERIWSAFTSMIKLEERVTRQTDSIDKHQERIEDLTERVIRLETKLDMLMSAAVVKRISKN